MSFKDQPSRDNKMFFINQGNNLDKEQDSSLMQQFPFSDLVKSGKKVTSVF